MKVAYSLIKKRCKYLCLCKETTKNYDLFKVFNLGFIIIFISGENNFFVGK